LKLPFLESLVLLRVLQRTEALQDIHTHGICI
jgi:hypothetical protein